MLLQQMVFIECYVDKFSEKEDTKFPSCNRMKMAAAYAASFLCRARRRSWFTELDTSHLLKENEGNQVEDSRGLLPSYSGM